MRSHGSREAVPSLLVLRDGDPVTAQVSREFSTLLSQRFGAQCPPSSDFTAWIMLTITFCASPYTRLALSAKNSSFSTPE
jgi:hypothetical protein